ncbi:hypothetical protein DSO57_1000342 [Entomophthora muscae]|uniref:Uncharacterized protein n=1 Tax=Entomophthora muscae TaxID=34485 RepID=A0ACC2TKD2_9FUNG|nr:hypothetical protein DSO57_1000342 [Entomophthora muscae]
MLLYLAVSLIQYKILAKAFCQTVKFYPIVYTLNSFEPPNLASYVTKVLPSILGPQEKLFEFNFQSEPISEPEEEQEQEPGAPVENQIELWDINTVHNICNRNGAFAVPATFPPSYPIMSKKGVPALSTRASALIIRKKPFVNITLNVVTLGAQQGLQHMASKSLKP